MILRGHLGMRMKDSGEFRDAPLRGGWEPVQGLRPMLEWYTEVYLFIGRAFKD